MQFVNYCAPVIILITVNRATSSILVKWTEESAARRGKLRFPHVWYGYITHKTWMRVRAASPTAEVGLCTCQRLFWTLLLTETGRHWYQSTRNLWLLINVLLFLGFDGNFVELWADSQQTVIPTSTRTRRITTLLTLVAVQCESKNRTPNSCP